MAGFSSSIKFASTHLYTWLERGTVRVKCLLPKYITQCPWSVLKPKLLDPELNALTMRPPHTPPFSTLITIGNGNRTELESNSICNHASD